MLKFGASAIHPETPPTGMALRPASPRRVRLRPLPYPFRAGLTLTNGVLGQTAESFRRTFSYLCGTGETPYGKGLGLELGFSFTLDPRSARPRFGLPLHGEVDESGPEEAEAIAVLARAGWIDTVRDVGPDDRFSDALERASLNGIAPAIAIDVACNCPSSRFVSSTALLDRDKFANDFTFLARARLESLAQSYDWRQWTDLTGVPEAERQFRFASTLQAIDPRSGVRSFKRFRGGSTPTSSTFPTQATSLRLDFLQQKGGVAIIEQNLALWSLIGAAEGREKLCRAGDDAFDLHNRVAWADIESRQRSGELLVCTASRLLDWLDLKESLEFRTLASRDGWTIHISGRRLGTAIAPVNPADLDGLAFLVEEHAPAVTVVLGASGNRLDLRREPDPTQPGYHALVSPWRQLERVDIEAVLKGIG